MEALAVLLAVAVISLPIVLLSPVVDRLFEIGQFRVIIRRILRVDADATLVNLPKPAPRHH